MSTRAELETAILTQPQCDARDAAYLDWLQEFEPEGVRLARAGLFHEGLRFLSLQFDRPLIGSHTRSGRVEIMVENFDLLQLLRASLKTGFVLRLGSLHYLALLTAYEMTTDVRGELHEIKATLLLESQHSQV